MHFVLFYVFDVGPLCVLCNNCRLACMFGYKLFYKYTQNIQTNLQILYKAHEGLQLNTLVQFKIYKHHKAHKNEILSYQITYNNHIVLYDFIAQ